MRSITLTAALFLACFGILAGFSPTALFAKEAPLTAKEIHDRWIDVAYDTPLPPFAYKGEMQSHQEFPGAIPQGPENPFGFENATVDAHLVFSGVMKIPEDGSPDVFQNGGEIGFSFVLLGTQQNKEKEFKVTASIAHLVAAGKCYLKGTLKMSDNSGDPMLAQFIEMYGDVAQNEWVDMSSVIFCGGTPAERAEITKAQKEALKALLKAHPIFVLAENISTEMVNGKKTYRVPYVFDKANLRLLYSTAERMRENASDESGAYVADEFSDNGESPHPSFAFLDDKDISGEVWIGEEDFRTHKVSVKISQKGGTAATGILTAGVSLKYGEPVTITPPQSAISLEEFQQTIMQQAMLRKWAQEKQKKQERR